MIFTDRTITVRKGESRIDEPIVVYRGDYELEVRFTILNSRFKFMSGTNMIESEKASYGQLAILTPYGGNIFSDIVRCNDGSVTFVLTTDMLNQIEEVGLYSFQIRLMDYNKESRVSIPPIEFGIEVREPIASEDHDNSVNNAIVGYSIAKVVDPKEENVGDTFDKSGNYNKTKWETGDRISQGKLNKIEDAIDTVNKNEMDNSASLSKRIDNNFSVLDATKADLSYVDAVASSLASGGPKGIYVSLNDLKQSIPNGDSNIYITSDNGCWNYWNGVSWVSGGVYQSTLLSDNSVYKNHINGGVQSVNLFSIDMIMPGYVNSVTLSIKNDDRYAYAKIPVNADTVYDIFRDLPNYVTGYSELFLFLNSNNEIIDYGRLDECESATDACGRTRWTIKSSKQTRYICINLKLTDFDVARDNGLYIYERNHNNDADISAAEYAGISKLFGTNISDDHARRLIYDYMDCVKTTSNDITSTNMTLINNFLINTSGSLFKADGWCAGKIEVDGGSTYCIYFDSQIYNGYKGSIMLCDGLGRKLDVKQYSDLNKKISSFGRYIELTVPDECVHMYITLKSPSSYTEPFNDIDKTIITKNEIHLNDVDRFVTEIHGKKVISPLNINDFVQPTDVYIQGNLFKKNDVIIHNDALYNMQAKFQEVSGWVAVDIPIIPGNTYYFYSPSEDYNSGTRGNIVLLDRNKKIIKGIDGQGTSIYSKGGLNWQVIETEEGSNYIGITVTKPNGFNDLENGSLLDNEPGNKQETSIMVKRINGYDLMASYLGDGVINELDNRYLGDGRATSPLKDKIWVVLGDSLTEFNSRATKNYHDYVAEETGVIVVNMGKSGTGYKKREGDNNAFYQRSLKIPKDADIITIFGSGNDLSLELGTPSDTGTDTICGCIHETIQNIYSISPGVRLGIVLPCPWGSLPPSVENNKMALYCEALKKIAGQYSIPVLDLYHGSNLRPWDSTFRDLYYKHDDGNSVHPDEDGHALLANKFKMFIMSL